MLLRIKIDRIQVHYYSTNWLNRNTEILSLIDGGILLPSFFQNPYFQVIVLFLFASSLWYLTTAKPTENKKKIFSLVTDGVLYFVFITLGLNALFNFQEVINEPYQVILFSSNISSLGITITLIYLMIRYYKELARNEEMVNGILGFFLFLGLFNHLFYYYKYGNLATMIFVLIYFMLYLIYNKSKYRWRNEVLLFFLAMTHAILMYFYSSVIIYYQIIFYPYQIIGLFILISLLLFFIRRNFLSKQK